MSEIVKHHWTEVIACPRPLLPPCPLCGAKEEERDSKSILPPTIANVGMCASMRNRPTPPDSLSHMSPNLYDSQHGTNAV